MKNHFALAGLSALFLSGALDAQTTTGFPPLPPVPRTGQLQDQPAATKFSFVAAGDNRPATDTPTPPPILKKIFDDAQRFKPMFFLWAGDIIYGHHSDPKKLGAQYNEFFKVAALGKAPVFNSPGNHEMDTLTEASSGKIETPDKKLQGYYLKFMKFPSGAPPYGAFNYGNSRFIAVDTEEPGGPGPSPASAPAADKQQKTLTLDPGFVSQVQLDLLAQDLEANKDKAHIFVFMHHPIKPAKSSSGLNQANAAALEALFQKYPNVSYVIAAHEHLYYNATGSTLQPADREDPSQQGPSYLVSGGAGAPLDNCPGAGANCMSHHHYLVFDVDGNTVKVQVVRVHPPDAEKTASR
jgi:hypothetical protein